MDNNEHIDSSKHDFNGIKISFPPQYVQNKNKEDNINNDGVNLKCNNMSNEPILHKIDENQISKNKNKLSEVDKNMSFKNDNLCMKLYKHIIYY